MGLVWCPQLYAFWRAHDRESPPPCNTLHPATWKPSTTGKDTTGIYFLWRLCPACTLHFSGEDTQAIKPVPLGPLHYSRTGGILGVLRRLSSFYLPLGSSFLFLAVPQETTGLSNWVQNSQTERDLKGSP